MGYEKVKRVVLEFTNNVAGSDSAMQVDQIAETFNEEQEQEHTGADPAAWTRPGTGEQYVSAFGKGASATTARVMATLRASVPPRARAKDSRRAQTWEMERA